MLKIQFSWSSPVYKETYSYAKKRTIRTVVDPCRKCLLLQVRISDVSHDCADAIYEELKDLLLDSGNGICELSSLDWGVPASYNHDQRVYTNCFCIPKDFDNLEAQKKTFLLFSRSIARQSVLKWRHCQIQETAVEFPAAG